MKTRRYVRTGGALGHLLLVVVLALGVFLMHGLGHPGEPSGHAATSAAAPPAAMDAAAPGHHMTSASGAGTTSASGHHATSASGGGAAGDDASRPARPSSSHEPGMAMDMMSLCVAVVFAAWVLGSLPRSALDHDREWRASLLARLAASLRPGPAHRAPDLTRLSVLRL